MGRSNHELEQLMLATGLRQALAERKILPANQYSDKTNEGHTAIRANYLLKGLINLTDDQAKLLMDDYQRFFNYELLPANRNRSSYNRREAYYTLERLGEVIDAQYDLLFSYNRARLAFNHAIGKRRDYDFLAGVKSQLIYHRDALEKNYECYRLNPTNPEKLQAFLKCASTAYNVLNAHKANSRGNMILLLTLGSLMTAALIALVVMFPPVLMLKIVFLYAFATFVPGPLLAGALVSASNYHRWGRALSESALGLFPSPSTVKVPRRTATPVPMCL